MGPAILCFAVCLMIFILLIVFVLVLEGRRRKDNDARLLHAEQHLRGLDDATLDCQNYIQDLEKEVLRRLDTMDENCRNIMNDHAEALRVDELAIDKLYNEVNRLKKEGLEDER